MTSDIRLGNGNSRNQDITGYRCRLVQAPFYGHQPPVGGYQTDFQSSSYSTSTTTTSATAPTTTTTTTTTATAATAAATTTTTTAATTTTTTTTTNNNNNNNNNTRTINTTISWIYLWNTGHL